MSARTSLLLLLLLASLPAGALGQTAAGNPSFNLVNRGSVPIRELYFTPAGDANWGRNRLAGQTIGPGASYAARRRMDGNCIFDVRVVFADGRIEDRRSLNTCNVDDVAFGLPTGQHDAGPVGHKAADDPSFKLVNRGTAAIVEADATPAGTGNWGQNRLAGPLPPQSDRLIDIPKGSCSYDLRVVFEGGRKLERKHVDLCRVTVLPAP